MYTPSPSRYVFDAHPSSMLWATKQTPLLQGLEGEFHSKLLLSQ